MNSFPLFICKSNAHRSPMAEGFFIQKHGIDSCASIAGSTNKKGEFKGGAGCQVIEWTLGHYNIDLSNHRIRFLSDLTTDVLKKVNIVVFLYDPSSEKCLPECKIDGKTPWEYFYNKGIPLRVYELQRIHENFDDFLTISKQIKDIVDSIN